jgi:hypothetical protein
MTWKDKLRDALIFLFCFIIMVFAIVLFPALALAVTIIALVIFVICIPFSVVALIDEGIQRFKAWITKSKID